MPKSDQRDYYRFCLNASICAISEEVMNRAKSRFHTYTDLYTHW